MKQTLRPISTAMEEIVLDRRSGRIERVLAAQVILALHGLFLPGVSEEWLDTRQTIELRRVQRELLAKVLHQKAVRKKQNRRALLRRKLRTLQETNEPGTDQG